MTIEIEHFETFSICPAAELVARYWLELIENGFAGNVASLPAQFDDHAIVAFDGLKPVGFILWAEIDWCGEASIRSGFVLFNYRRKGIYTALWNALVAKTRELKMHHIASGVHVRNQAMIATAAKQGREQQGLIYHFDLGKAP
jgi:GNAT superfamily N-acetyltransferase